MTRRILLTVLLTCAMGVAVFFVPTAILVRDQNEKADVLELQRFALVAARAAAGQQQNAVPGLGDTDPHHRYARYNPAGQRVAGQGPSTADPPVTAAQQGDAVSIVADAEIVATAPIGADPITGVVRVAEPLSVDREQTARALAWLSLLAVGAIAAAGAAGWWLVRRLLEPVTQLRAAADRLGHGDFTVSVPRTGLTEFDELGRALSSSARRVGRLVERERAFSADASHELRTPLAGVMVALETELMSPRPVSRAVIFDSVEALARMERTVSDLLDLVRDPPGSETLELCPMLREVSERWRPGAVMSGRTITVSCAQSVSVVFSAAALRHILDVLVDNALRHGAGEVVLRAGPVRGGAVVSVTDHGAGPPHPESVFRRRSPEATGTGIGLSLARTLAEAEGARLSLKSTAATFELLISAPPAGSEVSRQAGRPSRAATD